MRFPFFYFEFFDGSLPEAGRAAIIRQASRTGSVAFGLVFLSPTLRRHSKRIQLARIGKVN